MDLRRCEDKTTSGGQTSEHIRSGSEFRSSPRFAMSQKLLTSCPELSPPISMLAPPWVGEKPPLVPLICEARFNSVKAQIPYPIRTDLDIPQLHTVAIGASPIYGGRVSLTVRHWPRHNQCRPVRSGWIALCRNLLIRGGESKWLGDEVLFARAQAQHVTVSSAAKKLVEPVRNGIRGVRALARHDCPSE